MTHENKLFELDCASHPFLLSLQKHLLISKQSKSSISTLTSTRCTFRTDVSSLICESGSLPMTLPPRAIACFPKQLRANFWPKICCIASPQVIAYMGTPSTIVLKSTNFCFGWVSISFAAHNGITKSSRYCWQKKIVSQIQSNETSRGNALK